jgi:hypothetical protein
VRKMIVRIKGWKVGVKEELIRRGPLKKKNRKIEVLFVLILH